MGERQAPGGAAESTGGRRRRKLRRRGSLHSRDTAAQAAAAAAAASSSGGIGPLEIGDIMKLEDHPALKLEGAVCDETGNLASSYYKALVQPFRDREGAMALVRPGFREGEVPGEGLRMWDDTRRRKNRYAGLPDVSGAGWISYCPIKRGEKKDSRWWNVKVWGSFRLAFLMSRLQREVWQARLPCPS